MSNAHIQEPIVTELFDLSGKVSLITGASGHLGQPMARALAEAGSQVIVTSRDASTAEEIARALPNPKGVQHLGVVLDQLDPSSIDSAIQNVVQRAGRVDVLVNNAHEVCANDWRSVSAEQFNRQLQNATGYFLLGRHVRNNAVERGGRASIIMLGSMYGVVGSYPPDPASDRNFSPAAYHALKGGVVHLTRHLAVCWARDQVRVNSISPGPFPNLGTGNQVVQRKECPMNRNGFPFELKGAVVFLASDASSYVTGHNLAVDGGWTVW